MGPEFLASELLLAPSGDGFITVGLHYTFPVRITHKKGAWKIPSESISRMPMECLEYKKNFLPCRIQYIKFFKKVFAIEKTLKNNQKSLDNPLFYRLRPKI